MAAVNNVTQGTELIKMEQFSPSNLSGSSNTNNQHLSAGTSNSAAANDGLSGLDLFGHIVEVMPTTIPTVVESINNGDDLVITAGSRERK